AVYFNGNAGTTYYILAAGNFGATGLLTIEVNPLPPENDLCDGAIPLDSGTTFSMCTVGATSAGDTSLACGTGAGNGVWFTLQTCNSGNVTISTCGSNYDTALQVYTGTCTSLSKLHNGCNDNFCG